MKNTLLLVSITVFFLVLTMSPLSSGAGEPKYYVEGYVAEITDAGGIPMEGVIVSIDIGEDSFKAETKANGSFKVGVDAATTSGLMISFSVFGYRVVSCPNMSFKQGESSHPLDLTKATYTSANSTYTITGSIGDMQCAIMIASKGEVVGTVSSGTTPIRNATVVLSPITGGVNYTAHTNDKGYYELSCPIGAYTMSASSQGFKESEPVPVNVTVSPSTADVTLEKSELKKHLGMDMAHILMLIGVIVGIMLAVAAWFLSRRMNMAHHLEIIDDSSAEDSDIKHP